MKSGGWNVFKALPRVGGLSRVAACGLLTAEASLVVECGLWGSRASVIEALEVSVAAPRL